MARASSTPVIMTIRRLAGVTLHLIREQTLRRKSDIQNFQLTFPIITQSRPKDTSSRARFNGQPAGNAGRTTGPEEIRIRYRRRQVQRFFPVIRTAKPYPGDCVKFPGERIFRRAFSLINPFSKTTRRRVLPVRDASFTHSAAREYPIWGLSAAAIPKLFSA